ncbi:MAG: trypsin-like peptidase domain-containing protein [bacterium]
MKIKTVIIISASLIIFLISGSGFAAAEENSHVDFQKIIALAKDKVYPALVFIKPIREIFTTGQKTKQEVFGSGVIISPDGLVVTNNHVAEKSIQINCVLFNKEQVPASVIGLDPETDLALIRLNVPKEMLPLPFAELDSNKEIEEGQFVMALGSPFGFTRSISIGIISNNCRYLGFKTQYKYNTWIQTDAAINPGNSGGPLVNTSGKVIGINTIGVMLANNVGFAIPAPVVKKITDRLKTHGKIVRASLGLKLQPLKDFESNTFVASENGGVLIADVEEKSPAGNAGLMAGDILISINKNHVNGTYIEDIPSIRWIIADLPLDKEVRLEIVRNKKHAQFMVQPVVKGKLEGDNLDLTRWDMTVQEISKFDNPEIYFWKNRGIFIIGVKYPGNGSASGFQRYDIILEIDGKQVTALNDINTIYQGIMADTARDKKVLFKLSRSGQIQWVVLDYTRDYEEE